MGPRARRWAIGTPEHGSSRPEMGDREPEHGSSRPEMGDREPEHGSSGPEMGDREPGQGSSRPEMGDRDHGAGMESVIRVFPLGSPGQEITQNNQGRKGHTGKGKGEQTRINSGKFASVNPTETSGNCRLVIGLTDNFSQALTTEGSL